MSATLRTITRHLGPSVSIHNHRSLTTTAIRLTAGPTKCHVVIEKEEEPTFIVTRQAPNRKGVWAPSQQPREKAMVGPRFEDTDFSAQPAPYSAMELIHQVPVRWVHEKVVACDGGVGPAGHPRIYINTDKPQICVCNYCGNPFAHEHHRKHIESLPETSYPLA